jgi:hypothetical protein
MPEEVQVVCNIVSSVGFPIAGCFFLWKFITSTLQNLEKVINKNTNVLSRICDKLDMGEKGDMTDE